LALPRGRPLALLVARSAQLPHGGEETVAEAGGLAIVVGSGAREAAEILTAAEQVWWCETGPGLRPGALAHALAGTLADVPLLLLPASPDGRSLAPRIAAVLDRPLLAQAVRVTVDPDGPERIVHAELSRLDGRIAADVEVRAPAVATLVPGVRRAPATGVSRLAPLELPDPPSGVADPEIVDLLEPDPETIDLGEARRVVAGGGGLIPRGHSNTEARALFSLLGAVASALGASAGATRVASDAGWIGYNRQIGTTGVTIDPDLYIALGISGAGQHVDGLGAPRHVVSVNTDPSCPMTAMADLGLVTDARGLLLELAHRLEVEIPEEVGRG
jgi:electron transfer flavoprotein alpha subunit